MPGNVEVKRSSDANLHRKVDVRLPGKGKTQSEVVSQLTLLIKITVLHRPCSVAAEPLHH